MAGAAITYDALALFDKCGSAYQKVPLRGTVQFALQGIKVEYC